MSSNPRSSDAPLIGAALLGAALVVASLLLLVMVRAEIVREAYRTQKLRSELVELRAHAADLRVEQGVLTRPARIAQLARAMGMEAPTQDQQIAVSPASPSTGGTQ